MPAAGDHRPDHARLAGRRYQGGAGPGTGAKIAQMERAGFRLLAQPIRAALQALGQQLDVEDLLWVLGFLFFQKIDQERGQAGLLKNAGHSLDAN